MSLFPRLRAGSAPWLVRHEARMFMHGLGFGAQKAGKARSKPRGGTIVFWSVSLILLHAVALAITWILNNMPAASAARVSMIITGALGVILTLMLSMSLRASVESLFERGDLDLLLSSPLPSHTILAARLLAIAIGVAAPFLLLLTPLANVGLFLGHANWLTLYPTLLSMALVAAAAGMLTTLALVRLIGIRRTRVTAQVLAAFTGAFVFLLFQGFNLTSPAAREWIGIHVGPLFQPGSPLGPDSLVWLPGRAITGSALAVLALMAAGALAYASTAAFTHRLFVRGVLHAGATAAAPKTVRAAPARFRGGVTRAIVLKEWRLIARDPQLIAQMLLQMLYLLPMLALLFKSDTPSLPAVSAALAMCTLSLTGSLAWLIIAAEDAPDLLATAPLASGVVVRAKLVAVMTPPLLLLAPAFVWVGLSHPGAALLMACIVASGVCALALICFWCAKPAARDTFKRRAKGSGAQTAMEMLCTISWSTLVFTALMAAIQPAARTYALIGAAVALLVAAAVQGVAWALRLRRG